MWNRLRRASRCSSTVVAFFGGSYLQAGLNRAWKEAAGDERERLAAAAAAEPERGPVRPFPGPGRSRARTS